MRLRLFGKIFLAVLALVVVTDAILVGQILQEQTQKLRERIYSHNRLVAHIAARNIETGFSSQEMPYEMLSDLVRGNEAIFWLILRPDGSVYSASDTSFWAKPCGESVPQLSGSVGAQRQQIIGLPGDAEVLVEPLKLKEK